MDVPLGRRGPMAGMRTHVMEARLPGACARRRKRACASVGGGYTWPLGSAQEPRVTSSPPELVCVLGGGGEEEALWYLLSRGKMQEK